jgi:hypothetical protein
MREPRPRDRFGRPLPRGSRNELADSGPEPALRSVAELRRLGISLFDDRRFFEAHELFESIWKSDDVDECDRPFWKAVTQIAVGCCHVQRGNARGALALLERGAGLLQGYGSPHLGIETEALIDAARRISQRVRRRGASPDLDFPKFPSPPG